MNRGEIIELLKGGDKQLFARAAAARDAAIGPAIYLRGLIEYSNICSKNCLYCGIRKSSVSGKYTLDLKQILQAAEYAANNHYGSIVLQGGENSSPTHIDKIERIVKEISHTGLGITLSLGEQSPETYRRWLEAGATRYLLRIEASDRALYEKIHPADDNYDRRLKALHDLREAGYQVGTGVMVGLPFQTVDNLADDLLFMREMDIDMCGMGPYIVAENTPLAAYSTLLQPEETRLEITLRMIAILRLMMPDINIAATTALQAIDPDGRLRAIDAGANVVMPNLTPTDAKSQYILYKNKPMELDMRILERNVKYGDRGDSAHFEARKSCESKNN